MCHKWQKQSGETGNNTVIYTKKQKLEPELESVINLQCKVPTGCGNWI